MLLTAETAPATLANKVRAQDLSCDTQGPDSSITSFPRSPSIGSVGDSFDNALAETVNARAQTSGCRRSTGRHQRLHTVSDATVACSAKRLTGCQWSAKFPAMTTTIETIDTAETKETRIGRLRILVHPGSGSGSECTGTCGCYCVRENDES